VEMGLDPAALGPADALLLGSNWELNVHWCALPCVAQCELPCFRSQPLRPCLQNMPLDAVMPCKLTHLFGALTPSHSRSADSIFTLDEYP
jgi:hypothetical protein